MLGLNLGVLALLGGLVATAAGDHEDTWVVIVSGSRFWYNYRCVWQTLDQAGLFHSRTLSEPKK